MKNELVEVQGRPKTKNRVVKTLCVDVQVMNWVKQQGRSFNFSDFANEAFYNSLGDKIPREIEAKEAMLLQKEQDKDREKKRLELIEKLMEFKARSPAQRELANKVYLRLRSEGKVFGGDFSLNSLELEWNEIQKEAKPA